MAIGDLLVVDTHFYTQNFLLAAYRKSKVFYKADGVPFLISRREDAIVLHTPIQVTGNH